MRAELALAAVLMSGCSVATMERSSSSYRPEMTPRCTSSWPPIALDFLGSIAMAMTIRRFVENEDDRGIVLSSATSLGFAGSAFYGWLQRERCRDAFAAHDRFLEARTEAAAAE